MAQAAEKPGTEFVQGEVVEFATQRDRITGVRLVSWAEFQADAAVLTTGPWIGKLSANLDCPIASRPVFSECFLVTMPGDFPLQGLGAGDIWIVPKKNGDVILATYG